MGAHRHDAVQGPELSQLQPLDDLPGMPLPLRHHRLVLDACRCTARSVDPCPVMAVRRQGF